MINKRYIPAAVLMTLCAGCGGGGGGSGQPTSGSNLPPPAPPPNNAPVVASANADQTASSQHQFDYDASQGGATFSDPDGDALTYTIEADNQTLGLQLFGNTITGIPNLQQVDDWSFNVTITASDGRGGSASDQFLLTIQPNAPPEIANPNLAVITSAGTFVSRDLTQAGSTFLDPEGDPITYTAEILSPALGFNLADTFASGSLNDVGVVAFAITATDNFGASSTDLFSVAVRAAEPDLPYLAGPTYVYADEELPLPYDFRQSREFVAPFWDWTPDDNPTTNAGGRLGRILFYDKRLSITHTVSCGTCHKQENGFASAEQFDVGIWKIPLTRNTMGLSNIRYNQNNWFFADERTLTLESVPLTPITMPSEMGHFLPLLEEELADTSFYPPLFEAAFGTPEVTSERIAFAMAQFMRSMISYRARFDDAYHVMNSDDVPLPELVMTPQELMGRELYLDMSCATCHSLQTGSSNGARNNGLDTTFADPGAGEGGEFRPASLRNIEITAPYMHDGRFATLREVIDHYDHGVQFSEWLAPTLRDQTVDDTARQLNLTEPEKDALEAFLLTFTDQPLLNDPKFSDPFAAP